MKTRPTKEGEDTDSTIFEDESPAPLKKLKGRRGKKLNGSVNGLAGKLRGIWCRVQLFRIYQKGTGCSSLLNRGRCGGRALGLLPMSEYN